MRTFSINENTSFRYRGRSVKINVLEVHGKFIIGKLLTDYQGKNEFWEAGENKMFLRVLIK